jgi:hypothetical protein
MHQPLVFLQVEPPLLAELAELALAASLMERLLLEQLLERLLEQLVQPLLD